MTDFSKIENSKYFKNTILNENHFLPKITRKKLKIPETGSSPTRKMNFSQIFNFTKKNWSLCCPILYKVIFLKHFRTSFVILEKTCVKIFHGIYIFWSV